MKTINIIATILMITLLTVTVSALDTMKPATLNQEYIIIQTCSSCTFVNLTVSNTDGITLSNIAMTDNGSGNWIHAYTPTQVGRHDTTGVGDINGDTTSFSSNFEVTGGGLTGTLGFYFLILILSVGLIILGFSIDDAWVVVLGGFGLVFVGLYTMFNGIDGIKDPVYTWGLGIIILMAGAYFSVRSAAETMFE